MNNWIKCSDRLPQEFQSVLGYREAKGVGNFYIDSEGRWYQDGWSIFSNTREFKDITHWQPLPAPPED